MMNSAIRRGQFKWTQVYQRTQSSEQRTQVWMESYSVCYTGAQPGYFGPLLPVWYTHPQGAPCIAAKGSHQQLSVEATEATFQPSPTYILSLCLPKQRWPMINKRRGERQKPSSLASRQNRIYGTILFANSTLDQAEARHPLRPHPCSSQFLLLPSSSSLTSL